MLRNRGDRKTSKKRASSFRWKGLMSEYDSKVRGIVLALLWVISATLSFTQLGFVGIDLSGDYSGYVVVLLMPITLSAILLGPRRSALTGLFAGTMALLHATLMPLDYYEFTFVNLYSSVLAMTFTGFVLGMLFARVLTRDRVAWKRLLYVALVCIGVSWIYNIGFVINIFISLLTYLMGVASSLDLEANSATMQVQIFSMTTRTGNLSVQSWANAANMFVSACLAMLAIRRVGPPDTRRSVRFTFNVTLAAVAVMAFCITSGLCFVGISAVEFFRGSFEAEDEIRYLANQLNSGQDRAQALDVILNQMEANAGDGASDTEPSIDEGLLKELDVVLSQDNILEGYVPERDGYVFIGDIDNDSVYLSDVELDETEDGSYMSRLSDLVNPDVIEAAKESIRTGNIVKVVYDHSYADITKRAKSATDAGGDMSDALIGQDDAGGFSSELMYVMAIHNDPSWDDLIMMVGSDRVYPTRDITMTAVTVAFGALMALVFVVVSKLSDHMIVSRIHRTNDVLTDIEEGNLDVKADVRDTVEFNELSDHINMAVDTLKDLISDAQKKVETELATAKAIQESAIPRIFPPYPDNMHFDIYATMNAAKDVGGDFYDFFPIGEESDNKSGKLAFIMADVSGKGIPAALFMMKAKTQLRDYLESGMEIGEAVENANRQLCDGNSVGMFVTAWVGVLHYPSGHIDFVNAGHNPPLLWQHETGKWSWLTKKSGLPLGLFDGMPYRAHSIDCLPGEELFLYTDGVNEAFNVDEEEYGNDRLEALLAAHTTEHPREICGIVRRSVAEFAAGAEQSDDITMMALEVSVPPEVTATLTVPADVMELETVNEFIHTELDRRLCPARVQSQIDIAVEELFVNVCRYAYDSDERDTGMGTGTVRISYTYSAEPPSVIISLMDEGVPYNPLEKPDAVTPDNIADIPIGGLGILLAKKSVSNMEYKRDGNANILTITKKW